MDLTDKQLKDLHRLLLAAFPTRPALARLVQFELGQQLDVLTTSSNLSDTVFELIQWAQSHGADLLRAAVAANPDHAGLRTFAAQVTSTLSPTGSNLTWQERRELRKLLYATYTTDAQVRDLCLDFAISYRQLEGEDLPSRIASLLDIAEQRGQAIELMAAAREEADKQAEAARQMQEAARVEAARQAQKPAARAEARRQAQEAALWEEAAQRSLSSIYSVAFAPDGVLFATGSRDNAVQLWRMTDGKLLQTLTEHTERVYTVAFAPDGQILASGSEDQTVRLWRMADGRLLQTLTEHTEAVYTVAFAPDGQILASGSGDQTVRLWRVADGRLLQTLTGHTAAVSHVAFAPNGQLLASASYDGTVRLWRVADSRLLQTLTGHTEAVRSVAFAPDWQILASGSWDKTVRLWRVPYGTVLQIFTEHTDWVSSVAFAPDGQIFASASSDGIVRLWRMADGSPLRTLPENADSMMYLSTQPEPGDITLGLQTLTEHTDLIYRAAFRWLHPSPLERIARHTKGVNSIVFTPDGQILASGSTDGTVRLWRVADGTLWHRLGKPRT